MGSNWTPEQLSAIEARGTSLIVSAAAGSGKTSVLVERLLRQLADTENKIPADRLVVVTFTNDAAAQMKLRLNEALSRLIESENTRNDWLLRQQAALQTAKISTIHSFCFDLIRENVQSLELSAGFRIMDDTEEKIVVAKATATVMEEFYTNSKQIMTELVDFFCTKGDKRVEEILLSIYSFLLSIPFFDRWMQTQRERFRDQSESGEWLCLYKNYMRDKLLNLRQDALIAQGMADEAGAWDACNLIGVEADMFLKLSKALEKCELSWNERTATLVPTFDRIKFPKVAKGSLEEASFEQVKKIRNKYKEQSKKLLGEALFTSEEITADNARQMDVFDGLFAMVKAVFAEVWRVKLEKNAIGFSDAERLAIELLAENDSGKITKTALAKELSDYYKVIMIDEFQDANNAQDLIFRLISNGENLFIVGDVKQSIYRFRLADPTIFIRAIKSAERLTDDYDGKNAAVLLGKNFRSSSEVVGFVNFVFGQLMSERVGDCNYTAEEELVQGAAFSDDNRTTELLLIPAKTEQATTDENEQEDEGESVNLEARAVATRINEMLKNGTTVYDGGHSRACQKRDFCILLRNRSTSKLFVKELERYGLKAHTDEVEGYLKSREISVLINLLRVIDNPLLDIALVSVLMSPMFLFSADEVAMIRLAKRGSGFFSALCTVAENADGNTDNIAKKAENFLEILEKLRLCASSFSLQKLIRSIYDDTDFLSVVQVYKDGEQKRANLRLLLEYARGYEQNLGGGLSGFLRYINAISEQGGDLRRAGMTSAADDVVSVKTIHKSKGLEFPFVFLCRTAAKFNRRDLSAPLQQSNELGIGFMIQEKAALKRYPSLAYIAIREKNRADAVSEELRLLYVALTRAKERLFITIDVNESLSERLFSLASNINISGGLTENLAGAANSMQDWLLMALLRHKDSAPLRELCNVETDIISTDFALSYVDFSAQNAEQMMTVSEERASVDLEKLGNLRAEMAFSYDTKLAEMPAKLTVSEIAKWGEHEISLDVPKFITDGSKALTGAQRGVATHTFMQYANFQNAATDGGVPRERDRLVERGYLTQVQGSAVAVEKLEKFFRCELYSRISKAQNVWRERKFMARIADLEPSEDLTEYAGTDGMLQGIADCIFEEADGLVLVDYKTDYAKDDDVLRGLYTTQLQLYRRAIDALYEKKIKAVYLYSFHLGREILL